MTKDHRWNGRPALGGLRQGRAVEELVSRERVGALLQVEASAQEAAG